MFHIAPEIAQHAPLSGVAAPTGRTHCGGRSRAIWAVFTSIISSVIAQQAAASIAVPSAADVTLIEVLEDATDPDAIVFRARYLMPAIARDSGTLGYDDVSADFAALCETHALPLIRDDGYAPAQIVVSVADRVTEFGVPDPEATQFFEAFTIEGDRCIWEAF